MIPDLLSGQLSILTFIIWLSALVVAVTIHEFAHAWTSWKLGDPTAKLSGRLTLNPRAHFDLLGVLFLLSTGFGWGKPVPINPAYFSDPPKDTALVSLAGPASNLTLAAILSVIARIFPPTLLLLLPLIILNLNLAIFNLLPFSPLDGFKIISGVLPPNLSQKWEGLKPYGFLVIFLLLAIPLGRASTLEAVLFPLQSFLLSLLL